ncbi:MAG: DUF1572 family protein [Bacteroidota bacterium]
MLNAFTSEFERYRRIGERSIGQVSDEALNWMPVPEGNSLGMIVRHLSGNLTSRFTDLLTTDGEKPWRNREAEFEERDYSRAEVEQLWGEGWSVLDTALQELTDEQLQDTVTIRGQAWTIQAALARSLAHLAHHVGQMVLIARIVQGDAWEWISIPRGCSEAYNQNPTKERVPG